MQVSFYSILVKHFIIGHAYINDRQQIYTSVNHVIIIYAILCLPIGSPSGWRRKASKERLLFFMLKAENEKI